jgi:hypothetical protein
LYHVPFASRRNKEVKNVLAIDDLWLASYLVVSGARLSGVAILPYNSGSSRLRAVFQLDGVPEDAIDSYSNGDPSVGIHALRGAINRLRDLMYAELEKRNGNGGIKSMPNGGNGQRSDGQRRRGEYENRAVRNR